MQARIISIWATAQPKPPWFEIEATLSKPYSPVNLLDKRRSELPIMAKDNFVLTNVGSTWNFLWKLFGTKHKLSCLTTMTDNPDLIRGGTGSNFQNWYEAGIHHIYDLWDKGKFKTFESLQATYKLQTKEFYKYLQVKHYVHTKMGTLNLPDDFNLLEKTLLDSLKQGHFVSTFYSKLQYLNTDRLSFLRKSWETQLKTTIDTETWEEILLLSSKVSICNRFREMQYNILQNVYISPYMYSKYTAGASPNCPKCKATLGTRFHCLWECEKIQRFWQTVCAEVSVIIKQQLQPNPMSCLLGCIPESLRSHKNTVHLLLMLGRKAVMTKWVGDEPPSIHLWKSLMSDCISLERLRFGMNSQKDLFTAKFGKVLEYLGTQTATDS